MFITERIFTGKKTQPGDFYQNKKGCEFAGPGQPNTFPFQTVIGWVKPQSFKYWLEL
jgi:hypothetical protein